MIEEMQYNEKELKEMADKILKESASENIMSQPLTELPRSRKKAPKKKERKRRFRVVRTSPEESPKRFWNGSKIFFTQCFQGSREKSG